MPRGFPRAGSVVIAYLKDPRDRFWGILRSIDAVGIVVQGIDLNSFDDWVRQVAEGGEGLSPSTIFFPLARVEKLLLDGDGGAVPSLARQFERRVGRPLPDFLEPEAG
jgi:hypothetical protein